VQVSQRNERVEDEVVTTIDLRDDIVDLQHRLAASEARFETIIERSSDGALVVDALGHIRFANAAAGTMLGRSPADLVGQEVGFAVAAGEVTEIELVRPGPEIAYCEMRVVEVDWEGAPCRLALLRDMTVRHAVEAEMAERATRDALTHLPNRYLLLDRLTQSLARIHRGSGPLAVFFVDLDGFKAINDRYGHAAGDAVLIGAAHLLQELVRPGDTAARFGGDEFVLVCESMDEAAAEAIVERVEAAFESPVIVDGQRITVGASVGYALLDDPALSLDEALALADAAMYRRKHRRHVATGAPRGHE
jgi:diguanylate cyclase (GGDEF)-like protein